MIDELGGFLQRNLIVFVAVILLPLKWLVVRVCKDREAEAVALLSVPEDLCYVALGLVMGDVIHSSGAFRRHWSGSQHISIDVMIAVGLNVMVALLVHRLAQSCNGHFKLWRAAEQSQTVDKPNQGMLAIPDTNNNISTIKYRHLFLFSTGYVLQLLLAWGWIHWIASVLANT